MEISDLMESGMGAIIGFSLAQLVGFAKLIRDWWKGPKLAIDSSNENWLLLSHTDEVQRGEYYKEEIYGFQLINTGRGIATGVRVQLIKIECYDKRRSQYVTVSEHAYDLTTYASAAHKPDTADTVVLVPGATVNIQLAAWREDYHVIFPSVSGLPDYYEETCTLSSEYKFTVVAFDDKAQFTQKTVAIECA